jgi:hypothetical protein
MEGNAGADESESSVGLSYGIIHQPCGKFGFVAGGRLGNVEKFFGRLPADYRGQEMKRYVYFFLNIPGKTFQVKPSRL